MEPLPETPFVPEISHARVRLHEVPATSLEGEGWDDYVKPFRTIEDIHVVGAVLGYLSGVGARAGWARPVRQELAALVAMFAGLAAADPTRGATHLGLAGALDLVRRTLATLDWTSVDPAERDRWLRDRRLLDVAEAARRARTEAAWASAAPDGDH